MKHPNDDNGDALRRLEADGDDLSLARNIDFNIVFPDQFKAEEFATYFRGAGYTSTVRNAQVKQTHPWDVLVIKHMVPSHSGICEFEVELQEMADTLGGHTDGWGCFAQNGGTRQ